MKLVALVVLALALTAAAQTQPAKPAPSPKAKPKASAAAKNPFENESKGPITTEIYADEASFDSGKNMGIFTGHVRVFDPRFNLQSNKLTVYLHKGQDQGLEKAIAEGDVGVVRDRPDPNGGPPTHAVGRSEHAVYTAGDGNVELSGMPKVQQGPNMHIATSAETVMVINQDGHLDTHGPSRTEIRQEPNEEKKGTSPSEKPGPGSSVPAPSASPDKRPTGQGVAVENSDT